MLAESIWWDCHQHRWWGSKHVSKESTRGESQVANSVIWSNITRSVTEFDQWKEFSELCQQNLTYRSWSLQLHLEIEYTTGTSSSWRIGINLHFLKDQTAGKTLFVELEALTSADICWPSATIWSAYEETPPTRAKNVMNHPARFAFNSRLSTWDTFMSHEKSRAAFHLAES